MVLPGEVTLLYDGLGHYGAARCSNMYYMMVYGIMVQPVEVTLLYDGLGHYGAAR